MGLLIPVVSVVVAVLAAITSWYYAARSVRDARRERIRRWAEDAIDLLVRSERTSRTRDVTTLHSLGTDISAQIEKGRLYFENVPHATHGEHKPRPYQGYRPKVLDPLVAACSLLDHPDRTADLESSIRRYRREFIAEVQPEFLPRRRRAQ